MVILKKGEIIFMQLPDAIRERILELMKENILYSLGRAKIKSYGGRRSLK